MTTKNDLFLLVRLDGKNMTGRLEVIEASNVHESNDVRIALNDIHKLLTTGFAVIHSTGTIEDVMHDIANVLDNFNGKTFGVIN